MSDDYERRVDESTMLLGSLIGGLIYLHGAEVVREALRATVDSYAKLEKATLSMVPGVQAMAKAAIRDGPPKKDDLC
jgi:hypothetical protein